MSQAKKVVLAPNEIRSLLKTMFRAILLPNRISKKEQKTFHSLIEKLTEVSDEELDKHRSVSYTFSNRERQVILTALTDRIVILGDQVIKKYEQENDLIKVNQAKELIKLYKGIYERVS